MYSSANIRQKQRSSLRVLVQAGCTTINKNKSKTLETSLGKSLWRSTNVKVMLNGQQKAPVLQQLKKKHETNPHI